MQQVVVLALVASALCGAAQGQRRSVPGEVAKGNEGRGFGVPLYAFGAMHMSEKQDPLEDVAPLDLDEKLELTRGACNAWSSDMFEAVTDDKSAADKMLFDSWLPAVQDMYKRENKRELRGEAEGEHNATEARRLNIFLPNDMVTMTPANMDTYPARTVGRLVSTVGTCTATIIYEDLVLTNRHCLGITSNNQLPAGFWQNTYLQVGLTQSVINYQAYFGRVRWSSTRWAVNHSHCLRPSAAWAAFATPQLPRRARSLAVRDARALSTATAQHKLRPLYGHCSAPCALWYS